MAHWSNAYSVGDLVEVAPGGARFGNWQPGRVARKSIAGFPIVGVARSSGPDLHFAIDRKADIRFPVPMVSP